jgi:hypothetical protein
MKIITDYNWFRGLKANSIHLTYNDHATDYTTAAEHIEDNPHKFADVDSGQLRLMRELNSIWTLQIYPNTPIGSYVWYGSSVESVLAQARHAFDLHQWRSTAEKLT